MRVREGARVCWRGLAEASDASGGDRGGVCRTNELVGWEAKRGATIMFGCTRTLALPQATSMPGEILRPTIHSPAIRVYVRPELPDVGVSVHGMVD